MTNKCCFMSKMMPRRYPSVCEGFSSLGRAWRDQQIKELRSSSRSVELKQLGWLVLGGAIPWATSQRSWMACEGNKPSRGAGLWQPATQREKYLAQVFLRLQAHSRILWVSSSGNLVINPEQLHFRELFVSTQWPFTEWNWTLISSLWHGKESHEGNQHRSGKNASLFSRSFTHVSSCHLLKCKSNRAVLPVGKRNSSFRL